MICYLENFNEVEMRVITEYWTISEGTNDNFLYTVKQIYTRYKSQGIRPVHQIVKGSLFSPNLRNFRCKECGDTMPVLTRADYKSRLKMDSQTSCKKCLEEEVVNKLITSQSLVKTYNQSTFSPKEYIDSLTLLEMLAFLSLITDKPRNGSQPSQPFKSIPVVGIESIDHNLFSSLKQKGVIIDARSMPDEILSANNFISQTLTYVEAGYYPRLTKADFKVRTIWPGIYFRKPVVNQEIIEKDIPAVILKAIKEKEILHKEIEDITHIVNEIQVQKLYQAIDHLRKEYQIHIEESGFINSILYYFSKNHSPIATYFSLRYIAKETAAMHHTQRIPRGAERHVFSKLLSEYSRSVEKYNWSLDLTRPLPVGCQTLPLEAMFAMQYCGDTNFDRLSTTEIIRRWLESVGQSPAPTDPLV